MQQFWDKNKVFILGLLSAIALALQPFIQDTTEDVQWKTIGFAILMATLSFFARNWRGQSISIIGIVGILAGTFVSIQETGEFSWTQFILQAIAATLAAVGSDAKSRGYEQTATIKQAKIAGEVAIPAALTNTQVKKEANEIIKNQ